MTADISATLERSSIDWRGSIAANQRKTTVVIVLFLLLYTIFGYILDFLLWVPSHPYAQASNTLLQDSPLAALNLLSMHFFSCVHGHHTPIVVFTLQAFALLALVWTRYYHGNILLMGSQYSEITESSRDLKQQQLFNILCELKIASSLSYQPKLYVMQSPHMNAFASGWDEKNAIIVVTSSLLAGLNREELQAVLAHELSHIRHQDIKLTLTVSVLSNIMLLIAHYLFRANFCNTDSKISSKKKRNHKESLAAVLGVFSWFIVALYVIFPFINAFLVVLLSRTREHLADAGAVELLRDNSGLAHALLKIQSSYPEPQTDSKASHNHLYGNPFEHVRSASYIYCVTKPTYQIAFLQDMFSTHPSISDRLAAIGFKTKSD